MITMKKNKLTKALSKSPINYFSDFFIFAMVLGWASVLIIEIVMAIYSTAILNEVSLWSEVTNLVTIPLSCGGAIWMIKNSVQHAIMNNKGKECPYDFPAVNAEGESDGYETILDENEEELEDVG